MYLGGPNFDISDINIYCIDVYRILPLQERIN